MNMENQVVDILLVEDNPDDAELTIRVLKKNNLANNLLHLHDGAEALEFLFNGNGMAKHPKLVLLDIKMPRVDGIEVLRRMKTDERMKTVPVVLLTSSREERDIIASYKLGVNAYIVKPVEFEQFVKAVADLGLFWVILNQSPR